MDSDLETLVHNGAQFLDAKVGDWFHTIKVERLNMWSPVSCIIAQLFGGAYSYGLTALGLTFGEARKLGFDTPEAMRGSLATYDRLDHLWNLEIAERRTAAAAALVAEIGSTQACAGVQLAGRI
jgi:hypothetical protein